MAVTRIVILTGAGISQESGLETFRDTGGLWSRARLEDVATPEGFARDPALVQGFYNARRRGLLDPAVSPNAAHRALAALERHWWGDFLLVTQNIDDLHERAGSERLLHMHGELLKARCLACGAVGRQEGDLDAATRCPACGTEGSLRPDVVWFGEMPYGLDLIEESLARCDLFVSIGTSGSVYPAAGFVAEARRRGQAHTVEINLEPSEGANLFTERRHGKATLLVPAFVEQLLAAQG